MRCLWTKVLGVHTSGWRPFSKEHDPLRRLSDDGRCPGFSDSPNRSRGGLKGDLGRLKRPSVLQTYSRNSGFGDRRAHGSVRVGLRTAACAAGSRVPGRYSRRFGRQAGLQKGSVLVPLASPHSGEGQQSPRKRCPREVRTFVGVPLLRDVLQKLISVVRSQKRLAVAAADPTGDLARGQQARGEKATRVGVGRLAQSSWVRVES